MNEWEMMTHSEEHANSHNIEATAYKIQPSVIHQKVASEILDKCWKNGTGIISFKDARQITSHYLRLKRAEMNVFFDEMKRMGLIEIVPFHGIRIIREALS